MEVFRFGGGSGGEEVGEGDGGECREAWLLELTAVDVPDTGTEGMEEMGTGKE